MSAASSSAAERRKSARARITLASGSFRGISLGLPGFTGAAGIGWGEWPMIQRALHSGKGFPHLGNSRENRMVTNNN